MTTKTESSGSGLPSMNEDMERISAAPREGTAEIEDELDLVTQLQYLSELLLIKAPTHTPERAERLEDLGNLARFAGWELEDEMLSKGRRAEPEAPEPEPREARRIPFNRRPS